MTRLLCALAAGTVLGMACLPANAGETASLPGASTEAQSTEVALAVAAEQPASPSAQIDAASAAHVPGAAPAPTPRVKRTSLPSMVKRTPRPAYRMAARSYRLADRYERGRHCMSLGCPGYIVMGVAY